MVGGRWLVVVVLNSFVIGGWLLSDSRCLLRPSWWFFLLKACQSG